MRIIDMSSVVCSSELPGAHEAQPDPAGGPARSAGADAVRLALGSRAAAREGLRQHPAVADRPEPGRRLRRTARQREVTTWRALQRAFATASYPRKRGSRPLERRAIQKGRQGDGEGVGGGG